MFKLRAPKLSNFTGTKSSRLAGNIVDLVKASDAEVAKIIDDENLRQRQVIRLIPSENYLLGASAACLATAFSNKYCEGYPHTWTKEGQKTENNGRYYQGQINTNAIENLTIQRALELFNLSPDDYHANVQPLSGAPANLAVYNALLSPGDTFLGMSLATGGHLTHGHPVNFTGRYYNAIQYGLDEHGVIDYAEVERLALEHKPKLIVCGASAYPLKIDFARFGAIAKKVGAFLMADIAHISGLCSSDQHPRPFSHADVVTTTTHKILRGPRGGMIYCRKELGAHIDKAVLPGLQGGPHMNNICALAVALKEASSADYKAYASQVVRNAKALADTLKAKGQKLVLDTTENHLILVDLKPMNQTGTPVAEALEQANIILNKNAIPGDEKPWLPTGIRLGTPAVTTLGMKEKEMEKIGEWIDRIIRAPQDTKMLEETKAEVVDFMIDFDPRTNCII